jgi:dihydroneopterin aldolase/D-erythro-7,8-dihydroneopterin triphosphate epimerase
MVVATSSGAHVDRIVIRDLAARCILGTSEEERRDKQDIIVNVVLHADLGRAARTDVLDDTVDYRAVKKRVLALVEASSFQLVEALAEAVARVCLEVRDVHQVDVCIDKPGALRFARSVAVELTRRKQGR